MDRVVIFYPTTELHFDTFFVLTPLLEKYSINYIFLITEKHIDRSFDFSKVKKDNLFIRDVGSFESVLFELSELLRGKFSRGCVIVGNDGHRNASKAIRILKRRLGYLSIMIQDGWIEHINILRPVKTRNRIKWILHFLKNHRFSPLNKIGTLNIGATAEMFFVFSEFFKDEFILGGIPSCKIIVTGNPQFEIIKKIFLDGKQALRENVIVFFGTDFLFPENRLININALKWVICLRDKYWINMKIIVKPHPIGDQFHYNETIRNSTNISIFEGDIYHLFEQYRIDSAFTISSTVILNLLSAKVNFFQLAPPPYSKSEPNYLKDFPIFERFEDIDSYIGENMVHDINKIDQTFYIKDCDPGFSSSIEIVKQLDKLI